ncbi:MAG: MBL fold metallo-hydrolase [Pseudomonadota bacterium]
MSRINRTMVGGIELIALNDGSTAFGNELFPNATDEQIAALMKGAGVETIETCFNAFLIRSGDATILVDAGPRDLFGPTCGFLGEAMAEAGVAADDVTHLFFTHIHPDHVAGAITPEGQAIFANAEMMVTEPEAAFWAGADSFTDETLQQWGQLAGVVTAAYAGRTTQIAMAGEIAPGVSALPLPGHTPGHVGFRISDGDAGFLHFGDAVHAPALQFADPDISIVFDIDADQARAERRKVLDMAAADGLPCSGGHMLSPTLGRVERRGDGYAFVTS